MTHYTWRGTWKGRAPHGLDHQRARTVVRPTGGILRGKFPSRKTGRMVHHEGMLELDAIYHFEASPCVLRYTEQPKTVLFADGSRLRRYTPDFELHLSNGDSVLVEIKPHRFATEFETKDKLEKITAHFERNGQAFVVLTDMHLQIDPRRASLRSIYHQAPRIWPTFKKCTVELQRLYTLFPRRLADALAPLRHAGLDPYSLLMLGLLTCDLSEPFSGNTILNLAKEDDHAWFRLSNRFAF